MKVSELFEVIAKGAVSLRGKIHKGCGGKFEETSQMDDMDGVLHCTKCKKEVQTRVQPAELKKLTEGLESELTDAIKMNWMTWSVSKIVKELKFLISKGKWTALKNKSDDELHDYVDNAKDNARNQVDESLNEGMFVIKNKDGKEKRFKDHTSPEAVAWKASSSPKKASAVKAEKFSQEWWEAKEENSDSDVLTPWSRIQLGTGNGELSTNELEAVGKNQGFGNVDDFHKLGTGETKVDGVHCATIRVRVVAVYTKEDDLGIEGDDPVSDSYNVMLRRDIKNPAKFVFVRYM